MKKISQKLKNVLNSYFLNGENLIEKKAPKNKLFICSYPRSGNTVMRLALAQGLLSRTVQVSEIDRVTVEPYASKKKDIDILFKQNNAIIKWHGLPSHIHEFNNIIYLYREPTKACRSYYTYLKYRHQAFTSGPDVFIDKFLNGTLDNFGRWDIHVQLWKAFIENNGGCFLNFDSVIGSAEKTLESIYSEFKLSDFDKQSFLDSFTLDRKSSKKGKNAEFFKSTKGHDEFENALQRRMPDFDKFQSIYQQLIP